MSRTSSAARGPIAASLLAVLLASPASAAPLLFTTTGDARVSNEATNRFVGVTGASPSNTQTGIWSDLSTPALQIGDIQVSTTPNKKGVIPTPEFSAAPFDIKVNFSGTKVPTLEFQGTFDGSAATGALGTITSITSLNPAKNANLTGLFAEMFNDPSNAHIRLAPYTTGDATLGIYVWYAPAATPVPEPSTLAVFAAGLVGLGLRHRFARRGR